MEDSVDSIDRNLAEAIRSAIDHYLDRHQREAATTSGSLHRRITEATWLTVDEAVLYLGLRSRMALYQAVRRGQVRAHHFGRRLRFRRSELDEALAFR